MHINDAFDRMIEATNTNTATIGILLEQVVELKQHITFQKGVIEAHQERITQLEEDVIDGTTFRQ